MTLSEMKLEAIKEIAKLNSEESLKQILAKLFSLKAIEEEPFTLARHQAQIAKKYDSVRAELADIKGKRIKPTQ